MKVFNNWFIGTLANYDQETLQHSTVDVKYQGGNSYEVTLTRRNASGRVTSSFASAPIVRFTTPCSEDTYSYCGRKDGTTFAGGEVMAPMNHVNQGIYKYTADLGDRTGVFTPIIYGEFDDKINMNKFLSGSNLLDSEDYEEISTLELAAGDITVTGSTDPTSGNMALYSMLLYSASAGNQLIGYTHNNCMKIRINGELMYESDERTCLQSVTSTGNFLYNFAAGTRYYVEVLYTQKSSTSDFSIGFESGSVITAFTSGNVMRPLLFANSVRKTITFGVPEYSTKVKVAAGFIMALTACSILVSIFGTLMSGKKTFAAYSVIHYIQLHLLLPLIGITMGIEIVSLYNYLDFYLFNFNFLGQRVVFTTNDDVKPRDDFYQDTPYLSLIGLESASAFYNIGQLVFVLCVLFGIYLIVCWFYVFAMQNYPKLRKLAKWIFDLFHFDVLIRLFLMSYAFVLLATFSELTLSNEDVDEGGSWAFAFILFAVYCVITLLVFVQWVLTNNEDKIKSTDRINEFFRGCKPSILERSWGFYWMFRIFLIVVLASSIRQGGRYWCLTFIFIAQILYFLLVLVLRPFKEWVDYVVEVVNGGMLTLHLFILYFQDKSSRWDDEVDTMWLWFIVLTVFVNTLAIIGKF